MNRQVAIVGAGVVGRLLALKLHQMGWQVTLFDKEDAEGRKSCSFAAAGLLDPIGTLEESDYLISRLGIQSLHLWPSIIASLDAFVYFKQEGSLAVAHPNDREELVHLENRIRTAYPQAPIENVKEENLRRLEPGLDAQLSEGLFLPTEGVIGNRLLLHALGLTLINREVRCFFEEEVLSLKAHEVRTPKRISQFDCVVDCRGLGAKMQLSDLRGVRGELLVVRAPEVYFKRPVRLMHPRHAIYIVPRPNQHYIIGATFIECEDFRHITIRSTLELLSAAYTLNHDFTNAQVIETVVNCRPAFTDNLPHIRKKEGVLYVNGLFRHGYLIGPKVVELVAQYLERGKPSSELENIFEEM